MHTKASFQPIANAMINPAKRVTIAERIVLRVEPEIPAKFYIDCE